MVYFTCGACGEQLKKPSVEKHYNRCRQCNVLTCIDCLKDFYGDEYKAHTSCMSEAQRYSKSGREGWDPNVGQGNKGERKQQEWMNNLRETLDSKNLDHGVRKIVDIVLQHDNIPRKRPKFINFIKNIMRVPMHDIESTWELFSQALKPPTQPPVKKPDPVVEEKPIVTEKAPEAAEKKKRKKDKEEIEPKIKRESNKEKKKKQRQGKENEEVEEATLEQVSANQTKKKEKKCKKRKLENGNVADDTMEIDNGVTVEEGEPLAKKVKFDWDATIQAVLSKKNNQIKMKKLKKKCVYEYFVQNPNAHQTPEEIGLKFVKKINKRQLYKIIGEDVHLNTRDDEKVEGEDVNTKVEANLKNGNHKTVVENGTNDKVSNEEESKKISFNAWEATSLGSDAQTEKFRRLMGIKSTVTAKDLPGVKQRNDRAIMKDLELGFKQARNTHFKEKGMGLGWSQGE